MIGWESSVRQPRDRASVHVLSVEVKGAESKKWAGDSQQGSRHNRHYLRHLVDSRCSWPRHSRAMCSESVPLSTVSSNRVQTRDARNFIMESYHLTCSWMVWSIFAASYGITCGSMKETLSSWIAAKGILLHVFSVSSSATDLLSRLAWVTVDQRRPSRNSRSQKTFCQETGNYFQLVISVRLLLPA